MTAPTTQECEALAERLASFLSAYPIDVFPEPTADERRMLHENYPGLQDRIAASMARHMNDRVTAPSLAALRAVTQERDAMDKRIASMIWTADQMVWRRCDGEGRPQPGHDCRALVRLEQDGMCWIGIRAWAGDSGEWLNNGRREESAIVTHWMPLPPMPDATAEGFTKHPCPSCGCDAPAGPSRSDV